MKFKKEEEKDKVLRINNTFIKNHLSSQNVKSPFFILKELEISSIILKIKFVGLFLLVSYEIFSISLSPSVKGENLDSYPNPFQNPINKREIQEVEDPSLRHLHYRHILIHHFSIIILACS